MSERSWSDEELMAYSDGVSSPSEAAEIEAALLHDDELAERIALFDATRMAAQDAMPLEPVPDALKQSVMAMVAAAQESASEARDAGDQGKVVAFPRRRAEPQRARPQPVRRSGWMAMAAGVMGLALGLGAFFASEQFSGAPTGSGLGGGIGALASLPLAETLGTLPSGEAAPLPDGRGELRALAAFRNGSGDLCREFEVEDSENVLGVACHRNGDWSVDFAVASAAPADGGYMPASGAEALDAFLYSVDADLPLSPEDEAEALRSLQN